MAQRQYFIRDSDGTFAGVTESEQTPPVGATAVLESTILASGTVPRNRIRTSDGRWLDGRYVEGPSARPMTPEEHAARPQAVDPSWARQFALHQASLSG